MIILVGPYSAPITTSLRLNIPPPGQAQLRNSTTKLLVSNTVACMVVKNQTNMWYISTDLAVIRFIDLHTIIPSFLESSSEVVCALKARLKPAYVSSSLGCISPDSRQAYTHYPNQNPTDAKQTAIQHARLWVRRDKRARIY